MIPFESLLEVENSPEFMELTCPYSGLPIWPAIRVWVLRILIEDTGGDSQTAKGGTIPRYRRHVCAAQAALRNRQRSHLRAPIMLFATGVTNVLLNDSYYNRVSDPLHDCFPDDSIVAEWSHEWTHVHPHAHEHLLYLSELEWRLFLQQQMSPTFPAELVQGTVALVEARVASVHGSTLSQSARERISSCVFEFCQRAKTERELYGEFLKQRGVKLLVLENACYGLHSPIVYAARDAGIIVAEMQHGFVSSSHEAYNMAPAIRESAKLRESLPDYYLTWGTWWIDQIRVPVTCVPIGNPWLSARLAKTPDEARTQILIASIGLDFPRHLQLAADVREACGGRYDVLIRPHPDEKAHVLDAYADRVGELDLEPDLFRSLKRSRYVISEFSTVLFEALAAGCRVLVRDTPATRFRFPECPFEMFEHASELVDVFAEDGEGSPEGVQSEAFWTPEPEARYGEFIESLDILEPVS